MIQECIGVQRPGGGGGIIGNTACVLLLGVWGCGPVEKYLVFKPYKVVSEAIGL